MAWIELHQSVFTKGKTLAVADRLDIPEVYVVGHLTALWTWALDNADVDGYLRCSERVIAKACQWTGDIKILVNALVQENYLHRTEDGFQIHDWYQYAGKLTERRKSDAERKKQSRLSQDIQRTSSGLPEDTPQDGDVTAYVPNPTQPNRTVPIPLEIGNTDTTRCDADAPPIAANVPGLVVMADQKPKRTARSDSVSGTLITRDWKPSTENLAWAAEKYPHVNLDYETEQFRRYYLRATGRAAKSRDWSVTWESWIVRSAKEYQAPIPSVPIRNGSSPPGAVLPRRGGLTSQDEAVANVRRTTEELWQSGGQLL